MTKARKAYRCDHKKPQSCKIASDCIHPQILPGELYVKTSQGFLAYSRLSMQCAVAAGIYRPADPQEGTQP